MNLRDQLQQMRRAYRKEAERLDHRMHAVEQNSDRGLERVGVQMLAIRDQFGAVVESIEQLRADQRELARTLTGRSRLLEDRFGKMLEVVEGELDAELSDLRTQLEDLTDLRDRVEALERKTA